MEAMKFYESPTALMTLSIKKLALRCCEGRAERLTVIAPFDISSRFTNLMFTTSLLLRGSSRGHLTSLLLQSTRAASVNVRPMSDSAADLSSGEEAIRRKLSSRFQPTRLVVEDVSGDYGLSVSLCEPLLTLSCPLPRAASDIGGCGTFYAISIASSQFQGLSMVKQHKLVTEELKKEIEGIHGLQVGPVRSWRLWIRFC